MMTAKIVLPQQRSQQGGSKLSLQLGLQLALQLALILAAWQAGEMLVRLTGLPLPGSIAGMGLVLAALRFGLLDLSGIKRGADLFLAEMLLFFVPAVLAVLDHPEFLGWTGLKILLVILLGTVMVMLSTALTMELCHRWLAKRQTGATHAAA